jgi:MoaA/NifB/PqqE/SkfB family radical SAM enzyme
MKPKNRKTLKKRLIKFLTKNFDLAERIKYFRRRKIHTLEIELTNSCNLSCFYCYTHQSSLKILCLKKAKEIINQAKNYGIKKIVWLGGEPTLNPYWKEIVIYSRKKGFSNELWSNGKALIDNAEIIAKNCDRFVLHLDSINPEVFASVQNKKLSFGTHSKILQGLDKLLEIGYPQNKVRLHIVLSRKIHSYLEKTMKYFFPSRVGIITLIPLFSIGKGRKANPNLFLNPKELKEAFRLRALVEKRPERLLTGTSEYDKWYQMTTAYISANGEVSPYAGLNLSVGSIYEKNLKYILENSFKILSFSQVVSEGGVKNKIRGACGSCKNSKYCFGTRANSFFHSNNYFESDKTCWRNQK